MTDALADIATPVVVARLIGCPDVGGSFRAARELTGRGFRLADIVTPAGRPMPRAVTGTGIRSAALARALGWTWRELQARLAAADARVSGAASDDELGALGPECALLDHARVQLPRRRASRPPGWARVWTHEAAARCVEAHGREVPKEWR